MLCIVPLVGAIALTYHAARNGRLWLIVPALMIGIGGTFAAWRAYQRACARQSELDTDRAEAIKQRGFADGNVFAFSRRISHDLPIAITLFLMGVVALLGLAGHRLLTIFAFLVALIIAVVAWRYAMRMRGVFLEFSPTGIRAPGFEIAWSNVANILLAFERRQEMPALRVQLHQPLSAQNAELRIRSALSRGESDREALISLQRTEEPAAIIHDVALAYWRRMGGPEVPPVVAETTATRRLEAVLPIAILGLGASFIHGLYVDFVASAHWSRLSWLVACVTAAICLVWVFRHSGFPRLIQERSTSSYVIHCLIVIALTGIGSWAITARSLPDLGTRWLGTHEQSVVDLRKVKRSGSNGCRYRIGGKVFREGYRNFYCVSAEEFARLPDSGPMRLTTTESWFGMHIDRIEPVQE